MIINFLFKLYNEEFLQSGAGNRCKKNALSNLIVLNPIMSNLASFTTKKFEGIFKLKRLQIKSDANEKKQRRFKITFNRYLNNENEKIASTKININKNVWFSSIFFNFDEENPSSCLIIITVEEYSPSKILSSIAGSKRFKCKFTTRLALIMNKRYLFLKKIFFM